MTRKGTDSPDFKYYLIISKNMLKDYEANCLDQSERKAAKDVHIFAVFSTWIFWSTTRLYSNIHTNIPF